MMKLSGRGKSCSEGPAGILTGDVFAFEEALMSNAAR